MGYTKEYSRRNAALKEQRLDYLFEQINACANPQIPEIPDKYVTITRQHVQEYGVGEPREFALNDNRNFRGSNSERIIFAVLDQLKIVDQVVVSSVRDDTLGIDGWIIHIPESGHLPVAVQVKTTNHRVRQFYSDKRDIDVIQRASGLFVVSLLKGGQRRKDGEIRNYYLRHLQMLDGYV